MEKHDIILTKKESESMNKTIYKKYAKVAVKIGINLKKGQDVVIRISTRQSEFASFLVNECYNAKANKVTVEWFNENIDRIRYDRENIDSLSEVRDWEKAKAKYNADTLPCYIYVDDENPYAYEGLDMDKLTSVMQTRRKVLKEFRDLEDNKNQWLIIAVPSIEWAKIVFPNEKPREALKKLWEVIIKVTRLENRNPVIDWENHIENLNTKSKILNALNLDCLKYSSSNGTNLTIKLQPNHVWLSAREKNMFGREFTANMPTEEIFTMPKKDGVNGVVYSTKPLSYNGNLIKDFVCYFENGKCVRVDAKKGLSTLQNMLDMDEDSKYLGEVALVPFNSPINETGILFYNTLFDENACCHLAFGMGFKNNIKDYENMTEEDFKSLGYNNSINHVDFMIGSNDLEILGVDFNGKEYQIFKNGNWSI